MGAIKRRVPRYATGEFRDAVTSVCADHADTWPSSLVLYDVTPHYETDEGDGFPEPGFSKERRIDPKITVGMLTDTNGFPHASRRSKGTKQKPGSSNRRWKHSWTLTTCVRLPLSPTRE